MGYYVLAKLKWWGITKMKVEKRALYSFFLSLCLCQAIIVKISPIYFENYTLILRAFLIIGLVMLIPGLRYYIYENKYHKCNLLIILTIFSVMISAYVNRNTYEHSVWVAVTFSLQLLLLTMYCEYLDSTDCVQYGISSLFWLVVVYCVLSDILMFVDPHRTYFVWGGHTDMYFVGEKFNLTYLHLLAVILYCLKNKTRLSQKRFKLVGMLIWLLLISVFSECSTMIVGTITLIILILMGEKIINILQKPLFAIFFLIICDLILILNYSITQIPVVRAFIENILNESTDLTGRVNIYAKIALILRESKWLGVGIDNNYAVAMKITHAADVQNGLLDVLLSYGWVGIVLLVLFFMYVVNRAKKSEQKITLYVIYLFIALSSIEITFRQGLYVYFLLTLLYSWTEERQRE